MRPPNQVELSRDSISVWDTPSWDQHLIKLGRGKDGNKEEREWIFGEWKRSGGPELTLRPNPPSRY